MHDLLKRVIDAYEQQNGPLPKMTDEQAKRFVGELLAKAKAMRPVVTSCPHQEVYRDEKFGVTRCLNCQQVVHPDPEALKHGFLEYGRGKP